MLVELRDIDTIKPYPNNPRHNDQAVDAVAASIQAFGFRQPVVVDEQGVIIVGNTRYKAALKLGLKMVPVHVATGLSDAQIKAYRIADNKTSEIADWNPDLLTQELLELKDLDFDLNLLGFTGDELQQMLNAEVQGLGDPDEVPEPPNEAITKPGDVWHLGNHRLLCGDSTKPEHVKKLMDGAVARMMFTDPPWNVSIGQDANPKSDRKQ